MKSILLKILFSLVSTALTSSYATAANVQKKAPHQEKIAAKASEANSIKTIELAISGFNPKLDKKYVRKLAKIAHNNARKYNLDASLLISILNTESSFNQKAISSTNDISIAQINLSVWTPDYFKRVTKQPLNVSSLKSDEAYAISRMCLILNYYKKRYPNDRKWYARYHSGTPEHKNKYSIKIEKSLNKVYAFSGNQL